MSAEKVKAKGNRPLTHLDARGRARMVDVSSKPPVPREAVARGWIEMNRETLDRIAAGGLPKGDVLGVGRIAGILGAKRTAVLIPLCHTIPVDEVRVELEPAPDLGRVEIEARVRTVARTGVEMEALTAVCTAALAVYDMCKAVDRSMRIGGVGLVSKEKGTA